MFKSYKIHSSCPVTVLYEEFDCVLKECHVHPRICKTVLNFLIICSSVIYLSMDVIFSCDCILTGGVIYLHLGISSL